MTMIKFNLIVKYFVCLVLSIALSTSLNAQTNVPSYQLALQEKFKAGINISFFENYWKPEEYLINNYRKVMDKISLAHQLGFTSIRLPVAFDNFLEPGTNKINMQLLIDLQEIYAFVDKHNMNLIITYHYGSLYKIEDKIKEVDRVADMWSQVVEVFKGFGYDRLYFGLYNEPRVSIEGWRFAKNRLMANLRPKDLERYWIVGSTDYNGIDALIQLRKVPNDNKIIYTFHFYQPYIFTHQGAPWDAEKTFIKGLPYEYIPAAMPSKPDRVMSKDMHYNYDHYNEKASRSFIDGRIRLVYDWLVANKVPVICTETGAINTIPQAYRENYFKDVMSVMKNYGIPAMIWDLDQTFSIIDSEKKPIPVIENWTTSFNK
jgi:endoglucanase